MQILGRILASSHENSHLQWRILETQRGVRIRTNLDTAGKRFSTIVVLTGGANSQSRILAHEEV